LINRSSSVNRTARFNATQFVDKENDDSVFYTPMASTEARDRKPIAVGKVPFPFLASTPQLRRQTIASPLSNRNGPLNI
jgi:hypothetical protein